MGFEAEPIGQQVLQQGLVLIFRDRAGGAGLDIIAIGIEPFRTAGDLVVLDAVGGADEGFERRVGGAEVAAFRQIYYAAFGSISCRMYYVGGN